MMQLVSLKQQKSLFPHKPQEKFSSWTSQKGKVLILVLGLVRLTSISWCRSKTNLKQPSNKFMPTTQQPTVVN